ncbi:MAG TPA: hypothetical protein VFO05_01660, partial [Candidatus Limnocylindrales bacterium]|nr:hypothetical protein [Candidatus Limnocylindrales bacterium]
MASIPVVLAHGRAAEFEISQTMSRLWGDALIQGLQRVGSPYADRVQVVYAYFGGLWRPDASGTLPIIRAADGRRYTVELTPKPNVVEVTDLDAQAAPGLGSIAAAVAGYAPEFALEGILRQAIPDVFEYLDDFIYRTAANNIVADACRSSGASVLVGFSMGTIVGYDVLRQVPDLAVRSFVTCGSPIGLDPIRKYLLVDDVTPFPGQLDLWLNIWNDDDVATGVNGERLAAMFPGGSIQSARAYGRSPSVTNAFAAHNAVDYLSSIAMGL